MSRLNVDPLITAITELERDLRELKQKQFQGASSVLGYLTKGNGLNDFSTVLTAGQTKTFTITFTNAAALYGAIQQLYLFYSIDNTNVMATYVPPWASGALVTLKLQKMPPTNGASTWRMSISNTDSVSHTAYLKLFFSGTDAGSFNIV